MKVKGLEGKEPDWVYDSEDWETTYPWSDRDLILDGWPPVELRGEPKQLNTLIEGPKLWVVMLHDEDGYYEQHAFLTEEEAIQALHLDKVKHD